MANKEKLLANAQKFLSKGQTPKAISEYQKLVAAFPKDVRNRQKLAELFSRDKRNEDALVEYETVAKHYTETGFYLKAIAVFKQMQKIEPSRVDIYHNLAELNEKQGLVGNALSEYRNLVSFFDKKEMHAEAIDVLEKMLALDPDNLNYTAKIAECYTVTGQTEKAFEKFQTIIAPLDEKGEHSKIIKLYERFLDICPEDGASRLPLARALLNSGSFEKAIQVLKSLLKHTPEDPHIIQCLTDVYVENQDFSNARLTLKHLLKQKEDDLDLRESYVRICINAGEVERARDRLEEWKDSFFHAERATVLRGFYEELAVLLAGDPIVAETLSVIYEAVGKSEKKGDLDQLAGAFAETDEAADSTLLDEALVDIETLYMVGQEASADVDVPPPDSELSEEKRTPEKYAAVGLELDLDLELDLKSEVPAEHVEDAGSFAEIVPESICEEETEAHAETVEDDEIEIEIDLSDLDDFDLEFELEVDSDNEAVVDQDVADMVSTEVADDILSDESELEIEQETVAETDDVSEDYKVISEEISEKSEIFFDDDLEFVTEDSESENLENIISIEIADAVEEVEELEELEELEEAEQIQGLEELGEIEELDVLDEIEELEEFEALEEVGTSVEEKPSGKRSFAAALNVEAELEEAEFYLQQGLYDDAERVVQTLMEYCPELPVLRAKMDEIIQGRQAAEVESESTAFVDLMADLQDDELLDATDFLDSFGTNVQKDDELSQQLVSELDSADTESHYNLGIAYKEMGLYDDAVAEFDKASKDPVRALDCITLTGQCHMEAGETEAAMATFKSGLAREGLSDQERMPLNFEMGKLHQMNGQLLDALEFFQLVADKDLFFRDVSDLVKNLRRELGLDDGPDDDDGPQGNRDRVSYV